MYNSLNRLIRGRNMKAYFDNRDGIKAYITIYCDDEEYGKLEIDSGVIKRVEIPDNTKKIRISAVNKWPPLSMYFEEYKPNFENLSNYELKTLDLTFEKEKVYDEMWPFCSMQFPLDCEVELESSDKDLVFYQASFPQKELADAVGYRVRFKSNDSHIVAKYTKRNLKYNLTLIRRLIAVVLALMSILLICEIPTYLELLGKDALERVEGTELLFCLFGGALLIPMYAFMFMKKDSYFNEAKLKDVYIVDENGEWS